MFSYKKFIQKFIEKTFVQTLRHKNKFNRIFFADHMKCLLKKGSNC